MNIQNSYLAKLVSIDGSYDPEVLSISPLAPKLQALSCERSPRKNPAGS